MKNTKHKFIILLMTLYWITIFIATHIPIPRPVYQAGVSDKSLHFIAYLILTFLLINALNSCKKINWKKPIIWLTIAILISYGAIDEWLQQYVGRSSDMTDYIANLKGIFTGLILLTFLDFSACFSIVAAITIITITTLARNNPAEIMPKTCSAFHLFAYACLAQLWIYNISEYIKKIKPPQTRWLLTAIAAPAAFLAIVIITTRSMGRYFEVKNALIAISAILITIAVNAIIAASKKTNPS